MMLFAAAAILAAATPAAPPDWIGDLATLETGLARNYANFEYSIAEQRLDLPKLHAETLAAIAVAPDDAARRAALRAMLRQFRDPHIGARDLTPATGGSPALACDTREAAAAARAGLRLEGRGKVILTDSGAVFGATVLPGGIGVVRLPTFVDRAWAKPCADAARSLGMMPDTPCDDACGNRLDTGIQVRLSSALASTLGALERAGARRILVDLSGNSGGGDWAEVAARHLAGPLPGAPLAIVRHPVWVASLTERIADIDANRSEGGAAWQVRLTAARAVAARGLSLVRQPCDLSGQWRARTPLPCSNLARGAVFTTGFEASRGAAAAPDGAAEAMIWSPSVAAHANRLPLIVLIDRDTHSAAEQLAARLQDYGGAVVIGEVSAGAGCGHAAGGGNAIRLETAKLIVDVPDCARLRRDGSNERRGIVPDRLLPFAPSDSPGQRADTVLAALRTITLRKPAAH